MVVVLGAAIALLGVTVGAPGRHPKRTLAAAPGMPIRPVRASGSPQGPTIPATTVPAGPPPPRTAEEPQAPQTPSPPAPTPEVISAGPLAPVIYRLPITAPVVFVTIDDGWYRDPRVVDFIGAARWPITAFVIERAAREDPAYFRHLQAAGATIEDHTVDHPSLPTLGLAGQQHQICQPAEDFPALLAAAPTLVRPPYGAWNQTTRQAARTCHMTAIVEWSATMSDGVLRVAGPRLRGGDIILLHFRPDLYDELVSLRRILASDGLAVGRLESYLAIPPPAATTTGSTTTTRGPALPGPAPATSTTGSPSTTTTAATTTTSPMSQNTTPDTARTAPP